MKQYLMSLSKFMVVGIFMVFTLTYGYLTEDKTNAGIYEKKERQAFGTYFKEPIIIEKEKIVYVEIEPEPEEIVESPTYTSQEINTQFDIMAPSNITYEQLYEALNNSRSNMLDCIDAILDAEKTYGVNALYLTSMLGIESGWGRYETGYNNIAGWKGNQGTWSDFDSRYDCIMTVANGLSNDFAVNNGSDIYNVCLRYCTDYNYMETTLQVMRELEQIIF